MGRWQINPNEKEKKMNGRREKWHSVQELVDTLIARAIFKHRADRCPHCGSREIREFRHYRLNGKKVHSDQRFCCYGCNNEIAIRFWHPCYRKYLPDRRFTFQPARVNSNRLTRHTP